MVAALEHGHLRHLPVTDDRLEAHRLAHDLPVAVPCALGDRLPGEWCAGFCHLLAFGPVDSPIPVQQIHRRQVIGLSMTLLHP